MPKSFDLLEYNITVERVLRNLTPAKLYEEAILHERGSTISSVGALVTRSGDRTGRSPKDKRIVDHPDSNKNVWWGDVNIKFAEKNFFMNRSRAIDYLNTRDQLFVFDGYAGWDSNYRVKIRVVCCRAYHALFMNNMLIRPTPEQLENFGQPDYVLFNAGQFPANKYLTEKPAKANVALSFEQKELVVLGSEYAGEMKKGIFTVMNYLMPKQGVLSMHCGANEGPDKDVSLFFGLSGTGKTTLSAESRRKLIGDDEHCWTNDGIFNIEGGCYAKCIGLSAEKEPEIYNSIKFGTVLENMVYDEDTRVIDYDDVSITENTRASYPIEHIANAKIPSIAGHPKNVMFLTYDAFGVIPPISKLTPEQAMYHFISGYTAKVAGTEVGVIEPQATFSACFGAAFMVWHPSKYAELLAKYTKENDTKIWLVSTGLTGGPYGVGERIDLPSTRAIIDAIHSGQLDNVETVTDPTFGFEVPTSCPNVSSKLLIPRENWPDKEEFDKAAQKLADLFKDNFKQFEEGSSKEIINAGPKI